MAVNVSGSVCGAVEHCQAARCRVVKQVVRRVQCGGSSGRKVGAMCRSNVWQCVAMWQSVEWCGAESGGNVQWSGWSSRGYLRGSLLRGSSSAWLLLWHLAGFDGYLACAWPVSLTQYTSLSPCNLPLLHR
jgi:hypothetical protein